MNEGDKKFNIKNFCFGLCRYVFALFIFNLATYLHAFTKGVNPEMSQFVAFLTLTAYIYSMYYIAKSRGFSAWWILIGVLFTPFIGFIPLIKKKKDKEYVVLKQDKPEEVFNKELIVKNLEPKIITKEFLQKNKKGFNKEFGDCVVCETKTKQVIGDVYVCGICSSKYI